LDGGVFVGSGREGIGGFTAGAILAGNVNLFGDGGAFFEALDLGGFANIFGQSVSQPSAIEVFILGAEDETVRSVVSAF